MTRLEKITLILSTLKKAPINRIECHTETETEIFFKFKKNKYLKIERKTNFFKITLIHDQFSEFITTIDEDHGDVFYICQDVYIKFNKYLKDFLDDMVEEMGNV